MPEPLLVQPVEWQCEELQEVDDETTHDEAEHEQEHCDLPLLDPSQNSHQSTVTHLGRSYYDIPTSYVFSSR